MYFIYCFSILYASPGCSHHSNDKTINMNIDSNDTTTAATTTTTTTTTPTNNNDYYYYYYYY